MSLAFTTAAATPHPVVRSPTASPPSSNRAAGNASAGFQDSMANTAENAHDLLFKFIIIGDSGTGKSCLMRYFVEKKFKKGTAHTVGVEFGSKILNVAKKKVKLQIWDTAGQERFSYYRGALGCLLVYDVTSRDSYNHLVSWLNDARLLARPDITVIVVDLLFMETSALTGECVDEVFIKCVTAIVNKIDSGAIDITSMMPTKGEGANEATLGQQTTGGCAC